MLYFKTNVIQERKKDNLFKVYYRSLDGRVVEKIERIQNNLQLQNLSKLQQYFIETQTLPFNLYNENFELVGKFSQTDLEKISKIFYDIEVFNPERIPNPKEDPIISIAMLSRNKIKVFVKGEKKKIDENYVTVEYCEEEKFLRKFLDELFQSHMAIGHNTYNFDNSYIQERAKVLKLEDKRLPISYTPTTLFERKKAKIFPGIINIDLLHLVRYFDFPSTSLEFLSKIWKFRRKDVEVEELYKLFLERNYEKIIEHNVDDVLLTKFIFEKVENLLWYLGEFGIGTLEYVVASYHSFPKLCVIRDVFEFLIKKGYRIEEILKKIDKELNKIRFFPKVRMKSYSHTFIFTPCRIGESYVVFNRWEIAKELIKKRKDMLTYSLKKILDEGKKNERIEKFALVKIVDNFVSLLEKSEWYKKDIKELKENLGNVLNWCELKHTSPRFSLIDLEKKSIDYFELDSLVIFKNLFIGKIKDYIFGSNIATFLREQPDYFKKIIISAILSLIEKGECREIDELVKELESYKIDPKKLILKVVKKRELSEITKKSLKDEIIESIEKRYGKIEKNKVIKVIKTTTPEKFMLVNEVSPEIIDMKWYLERAKRIQNNLKVQTDLSKWF